MQGFLRLASCQTDFGERLYQGNKIQRDKERHCISLHTHTHTHTHTDAHTHTRTHIHGLHKNTGIFEHTHILHGLTHHSVRENERVYFIMIYTEGSWSA